MNIVVTGATSFVGTGAVKELLDRGHCVFAVLRENSAKADKLLQNGKIPENLTILEEDLGNLGNLVNRMEEHCDVFLHMGRSRKQFQKRRRDPGEKRAGRPECGEDGKGSRLPPLSLYRLPGGIRRS